ncbi:MAG: MBL fold metallo-hydrolase [Candidatus Korobacteraceae bacterium]
MQIKFWGVRGSTPTPQVENLRYGGNTPCVEVRVNGRIYVFDCGTGFRILGKELMREFAGGPIQAHVFLSHFHWDHIQGIPFFAPLYDRHSSFVFHSSDRAGGLRATLEQHMADPFFPVNMTEMAARRSFHSIAEGRTAFDDCAVDSLWLNHPQGCLGFRVEAGNSVLAYATDNEPGDPVFDKAVRRLAQDADVLIYDAQYLPEEFASHRGWGHSHWREAIAVARQCQVKHLVLFHHDPDHSDECIDRLLEQAQQHFSRVSAAAEGMALEL